MTGSALLGTAIIGELEYRLLIRGYNATNLRWLKMARQFLALGLRVVGGINLVTTLPNFSGRFDVAVITLPVKAFGICTTLKSKISALNHNLICM